MLIRTQLRLAAVLPAVLVVVAGSVLWAATVKVDRAREHAEGAERALRFNFELNILSQEYLMYGGERVASQLRLRHESLGEILGRLEHDDPEKLELLDGMRRSHRELGSFYDLLLEGKVAAREQIVGALLVKAQDMRAKTRQFAEIQHQHIIEYQRQADRIVVMVAVALALVSVVLLTLMARRMIRDIGLLTAGMQRVAAGDLVHRLDVAGTDEFGMLATQFNTMSDRLRDSYASIDQLSKAIAARDEAQREIHQLNAELEQRVHQRTAELEATNKELEAFSYSVSHDLRAPLRAVDGFSRKVLAGYGGRLDDEGRRLLQVVRDNAQRMGQLIDDLLSFSRMGRREMGLQAIDVDAMVKGVIEETRAVDPKCGAKFTLQSLPSVQGDVAMLRQVWLNLLGNAVKFSRGRTPPRIEVGGRVEGGEVIYWVRDNGAGFDDRFAGKLFGVFQRLHRQDEFEGTGVGLAIAQRILHRHNGRIWAEGKPDAGATFSFALPARAIDTND